MLLRRYRVRWGGTDNPTAESWTDPMGLVGAMDDVQRRLKELGGSVRLHQIGSDFDFGPRRSKAATINRLDRILPKAGIGDAFVIDDRDGNDQGPRSVVIRKVKIRAVRYDGPGTDALDRLHADVWAKFPNLESWGVQVCKRIEGSSSWSYHAWGQAEDIHASVDVMDEAAHYLVRNAQRLSILHVLWRGRSMLTGNPVADHDDHVHVDVGPEHDPATVPPCAK